MNGADAVNGNGTGVRGMKPGNMLVGFVGHCARRFNAHIDEAIKAPPHGPTKKALALLEERKAVVPVDKPQAAGRPSNKRKKGAMDVMAKAAYKARHPDA